MKNAFPPPLREVAIARDLLANNVQKFADRFQQYKQSPPEIQETVHEMVEIVSDASSTEDERGLALDVLVEALYPGLELGQESKAIDDLANYPIFSRRVPGGGLVTRKVSIPAESLKYVTGVVDIRFYFSAGGVEWVRIRGNAEWIPWVNEGATIPYYEIDRALDGSLRARQVVPPADDAKLHPNHEILSE